MSILKIHGIWRFSSFEDLPSSELIMVDPLMLSTSCFYIDALTKDFASIAAAGKVSIILALVLLMMLQHSLLFFKRYFGKRLVIVNNYTGSHSIHKGYCRYVIRTIFKFIHVSISAYFESLMHY